MGAPQWKNGEYKMVENTLAFKVLHQKERETQMDDLYAKAKLLVEKIKIEVIALEESLEFFNDEHGVGSDNIEALEHLLEQIKTLNGRTE